MLMKSVVFCAALLAVPMFHSVTAVAVEPSSVKLPAESKLVVKLDMEAMQKSGFGKKLTELVMERLLEEIADRAGISVPGNEEVQGFLGFNPIEETRSIIISASDFQNPENGILAIIAMKKSIGNVEAMLPSVPGYAVKKVGDHTIHSASPQEKMQIHLAIHTCAEGNKTLVAGSTEEIVTQHLARMEGKSSSDEATYDYTPCAGAMIDLHVKEIPADRLGEGPQTVIATMVDSIAFHLIDDSKALNLSLDLTAVDDQGAQDLDGMLQSVVPMLESEVSGFVEGLKVNRDGKKVSLAASMDSEQVVTLLSEQFDRAVGTVQEMLNNK